MVAATKERRSRVRPVAIWRRPRLERVPSFARCYGDTMASKKAEAVRQAVRDALESWYGPPPSIPSSNRLRAWGQSGVRTELSTTVFSADPEQWVRYLT